MDIHCIVLRYHSFFFSSRRRHTRFDCDWSSDVCSSDLAGTEACFYLANFSREGERVRSQLKHASVPAYLVFFTLTGAALQLGALAQLWPWVLLLIGLRIVSLRYGVLWAGRHPDVTPVLARERGLGLVSQAGWALALAQLARRAVPGWGVSLETLVVAMIGVHEGAGPICFRQALVRAGEAREWAGTHGGAAALGGVGGAGAASGTGVGPGGVLQQAWSRPTTAPPHIWD